eukprot:5255771-Amphidinium_carterae.1
MKAALLDDFEAQSPHKVNTVVARDQSLKKRLDALKLAHIRYEVPPEPRRVYLAFWSRVQNLHDTQPGFAAMVQRHLDITQVRAVQDLDMAIMFAMQ